MSFGERAGAALGRQLARPSGVCGHIVGMLMRFANRKPNRRLIEELDIRPHHRVLDIGCADGSVLAGLRGVAYRAGVDQSGAMVHAARRRLAIAIGTGRASIVQSDMLALPFPNHSFDRLIASNVLYFCREVPGFLAECRRVGRDGARLGIYVTSKRSMASWSFASATTHRHFDRADLEEVFAAAGIKREAYRVDTISLPRGIEGLIAIVEL